MPFLRIISDIHSQRNLYLNYVQGNETIQKPEYSIQLGDLDSKDYDWLKIVDSNKHFFLAGNHDNYNCNFKKISHCLGDYGTKTIPEFGTFFFARGAFSINHKDLIEGKNYWRKKEQLNFQQAKQAIKLYEKTKPELVFSHDCPWCLIPEISNPLIMQHFGYEKDIQTITNQFLDKMFEIHQPKYWFFGHHHVNFERVMGKTTFRCIKIYEYLDLEKDFLTKE